MHTFSMKPLITKYTLYGIEIFMFPTKPKAMNQSLDMKD